MAALAQVLKAPDPQASTAPDAQSAALAAGAVPATTPPAAAPAAPSGALGRAVSIMGGAKDVVAADPLMKEAADAQAKDEAAKAAAAATIQQNNDQMTALVGQPDPERPSIPRLDKLPAAPVPEKKNPLRVFGELLPMIAALGALTTKEPALNALNAATAMINAAKAKDKEEEEKQRQTWKDQLALTVQNNQQLLSEYKLALDDRNLSMSDKMAKIQALAALNRDALTLASLQSGNLDGLVKLITLQTTATNKLAGLVVDLQKADAEAAHQRNQELMQWAQLEISRRNADKLSMGDAIGPVLQKIQQVGALDAKTGKPRPLSEILSPGEVQALDLYMRMQEGRPYTDTPGQATAAAGAGSANPLDAVTGGAAPASAPASPAPAPPPQGLPPQALARLREGVRTTFNNGEVWTLRGGKPVRISASQ